MSTVSRSNWDRSMITFSWERDQPEPWGSYSWSALYGTSVRIDCHFPCVGEAVAMPS